MKKPVKKDMRRFIVLAGILLILAIIFASLIAFDVGLYVKLLAGIVTIIISFILKNPVASIFKFKSRLGKADVMISIVKDLIGRAGKPPNKEIVSEIKSYCEKIETLLLND